MNKVEKLQFANDVKEIVEVIFNKCTGRHIDWCMSKNILQEIDSFEFISLVVALEETLNIEFDDEKLLLESYNDMDDFLEYLLYMISKKMTEVI